MCVVELNILIKYFSVQFLFINTNLNLKLKNEWRERKKKNFIFFNKDISNEYNKLRSSL